MCEPYAFPQSALHTQDAFTLLKRLRKHDVMRVVKTWVNSWATSDRYHEAVRLPCLFGCRKLDKLPHYVFCPILFFLVSKILPVPAQPLERIGLVNPTLG